MILRYPEYYEQFQCIAGRCEDTCCAGWEIDIDDDSYKYYMSIEGEFVERLRNSIKEYEIDDEDVYESHGFILTDKHRCPFLDNNNLCDLYRELGEEALCDVCTDTPRNYLEYGGDRELSLSASCAEAGRLLYGNPEKITFVEKQLDEVLDFEETQEELVLADAVRFARNNAIQILQNRNISISSRMLYFLKYAECVQHCLNEDTPEKIKNIDFSSFLDGSTTVDCEAEKETVYLLFLKRFKTFTGLESISEEWEEMLRLIQQRYVQKENGADDYIQERRFFWKDLERQGRLYEYEHMLVYYSFLCLARCVDDYDFLAKAKLVIVSFLMILDMDCACYAKQGRHYTKQDRVRNARIYAKEVEHSGENLDYLADEFLFEDAYKIENLCLVLTIV